MELAPSVTQSVLKFRMHSGEFRVFWTVQSKHPSSHQSEGGMQNEGCFQKENCTNSGDDKTNKESKRRGISASDREGEAMDSEEERDTSFRWGIPFGWR